MPKEKEPTTEVMNIEEPSKAIKLYKITPAEMAAKLKDYDHLKVIEGNTTSYKEVRAALTILVHTRTGIDAWRKQLGNKLRKSLGNINKAGGMLIEPMTPYEERFSSELKVEDERKLAIKAEREAKETERIADIRTSISQIQNSILLVSTMTLKQLRTLSEGLEDINITEKEYMELTEEAEKVLDAAYETVQKAIAARIKLDQEAEERKAKDAQLEKVRKKQEAAQKKIDAAQKQIDDDIAKIEADKEADRDRKTKFRADALFSIGLMWDGKQYGFMDINVHWTDIATLSDDDFDDVLGHLRSKIITRKEEEAEKVAKEATEKAEAAAAQKLKDAASAEGERAKLAAAEKARKEAAKPDGEKLIKWIENFNETAIPTPSLKTKKANEILRIAKEQIEMLLQDVMAKIEKL